MFFDHGRLGVLEWARAGRPMPGESDCGDLAVVLDGGGSVVFAVIDGLGHGPEAAAAAGQAAAVLADNRAEPLDVLMVLCHRALTETRGVAMSLATVDLDRGVELRWTGVGNIDACVIEATPGGPAIRSNALLLGGIVGYHLPTLVQPQPQPLRLGELLVMATDGIRSDFLRAVDLSKTAKEIAADLLASQAKESDDAVVLVARHRGVAVAGSP